MKKKMFLFLVMLLSFSFQGFTSNGIDEKFLQLFQSGFPKAEGASWEEFPYAYAVSFKDEGIQTRIVYAKDKSSIRVTRFYDENTVPYQVRYIIASKYPGKTIAGVNEISTISISGELEQFYYLTLEDAQTTWTIKMSNNGNREVVNKAKRKWVYK